MERLTEMRPLFRRRRNRSREQVREQHSKLERFFDDVEEMPFDQKQAIMDSIMPYDYTNFRGWLTPFSDILGRRQSKELVKLYPRLEQSLKSNGIPVGKYETNFGHTRFILRSDLNKYIDVAKALIQSSGLQIHPKL